MDITAPSLEEQPAPAPWLAAVNGLDVKADVEEHIDRHPDISVDEIVAELGREGIEVNGTLVAQQVLEHHAARIPRTSKPDPTCRASSH
jgi:hypothetical protein